MTTTRAPRPTRTPQPIGLWVIAGMVLIAALAPVGYLLYEVLLGGREAWDVLNRSRTWELFGNSIGLAAAVTLGAVVIGVGAAWLVTMTDLPGSRLWTVLLSLPLVMPSYVMALTLIAATGPAGVLGLPRIDGFAGSTLALVASTYPYVFLPAVAGFRRLDQTLEEAAAGLGSSRTEVLRRIVLPQMRPTVGPAALLVALYTLSDFGAVSLLRFDTLTRGIYLRYEGLVDRTPALVLSSVLIIVSLTVVAVERKSRGAGVYFRRRPARTRQRIVLPAAGRWVGSAALATTLATALLIPVAVLATWVGRGVQRGTDLGTIRSAAIESTVAAGGAALLALVVAVPLAILMVRFRTRSSELTESALYLVYSMPHIAVALAVLFLIINLVRPLYQTLPLLWIVYVILFLPLALGPTTAAVESVDPQLEEASRGLGKGRTETLRRITWPLIGRGATTGAALVFLTAIKELPATLILRPTGFDPLAVLIWARTSEGFLSRASVAALVLLAVSVAPVYLLDARRTLSDV